MNQKSLFIILGIAIGIAGFFIIRMYMATPTADSPIIDIHEPTPTATTALNSKTPSATAKPAATSSARALIDVPFTSQAPYANWDALHEEMCEEGTIIMANAWVNGINLTPAYAEQQIQKLSAWETANFGSYTDETVEQTAQVAQTIYGLKTRLLRGPTVQEIKNEINAGNIVIMGMAGRMLHNPNYSGLGPIYHMMLIKGYDPTGFITNDDGTRKGESYHYAYDVLMAAAHNWNGNPDDITTNPAVAFVVSK